MIQTRIVLSVMSGVCLAMSAQASVMTSDWLFSYGGTGDFVNGPFVETPEAFGTENTSPLGVASVTSHADATATFSGYAANQLTYNISEPDFPAVEGHAQGTYYMVGGQLTLTMQNPSASSPADYSLTVIQAVATVGGGLDGLLTLSVPNSTYAGRTTLETASAQRWVKDTWTWSSVSFSGTPTLTITPTTPGGDILLDEVQWTVVPEPIYAQGLAVAGMVALGIGSSLRRKWQKRR